MSGDRGATAARTPSRVELAPGYSICRVINGCWQLATDHGGGAPDGAPDGARTVEALLDLAEAGLTTFDGADIYTGVEALLGRVAAAWRARHPGAAPLEIHTKYVPDASALAGLRRGDVERAVDRSLARLGVERLDLVQFHWWDWAVPGWLETAGHLDRLREAGKIARLGLTNFDLPHLRALVEAGLPVASNQVQYSLLDRRPAAGLADYCAARGIGLIAYGVLAGGLLSERWLGAADPVAGEPGRAKALDRSKIKYRLIVDELGGWPRLQELLGLLAPAARRRRTTIAQLAARWTLERPGVAAVLLGTRGSEHLEENRRLLDLDLDAETAASLAGFLERHRGPGGAIYALERRPGGRHRAVLRTELHGAAGASRESGSPETGSSESERAASRSTVVEGSGR